MYELVFDTNVLVAALRSRHGASNELLRLVGRGKFRLNISVALALEYEDVLKRKDLVPGYTASEIDALLAYFFQVSNLAPIVLRKRPILRDPDDERILEVAVQCGAVIVTHNTRDFAQAASLELRSKRRQKFLRS